MAEDWAENVRKFVADAEDAIIAGIVSYCGIALRKRDSSLVSFSDPKETGRVRENFLKKKLARTDSDDVLDAAIAAVGERMKGENFKNRVTVYYLLADHFGALEMFRKKASTRKKKAPEGGLAATGAGTAALGLAALGSGESTAAASTQPAKASAKPAPTPATAESGNAVSANAAVTAVPAATPPPASAAGPATTSGSTVPPPPSYALADRAGASEDEGSGLGWLWWLLLLLLGLLLLWWLFFRNPAL